MKFLEDVNRRINDPNTSVELRASLKQARDHALAKYNPGRRVHVHGIAAELTVVDVDVYGPDAQWYALVHDDPTWQPPPYYTVNANYGKLRIIVHLNDIRSPGEEDRVADRIAAHAKQVEGLELARFRVADLAVEAA